MKNSLSHEKKIAICAACGAPISPGAATCPTCRVSLIKPKPARVAREVALYFAVSIVVTLLLVSLLILRNIYIFAVFLQGILPFVVFLALAYYVVRLWKR